MAEVTCSTECPSSCFCAAPSHREVEIVFFLTREGAVLIPFGPHSGCSVWLHRLRPHPWRGSSIPSLSSCDELVIVGQMLVYIIHGLHDFSTVFANGTRGFGCLSGVIGGTLRSCAKLANAELPFPPLWFMLYSGFSSFCLQWTYLQIFRWTTLPDWYRNVVGTNPAQ